VDHDGAMGRWCITDSRRNDDLFSRQRLFTVLLIAARHGDPLSPSQTTMSSTKTAAAVRSNVAGPAIETKGLTKRYGEIVAVDKLSITVPRGGVTGFVGPNGAGKTTTIRMLLGLVRPSAGSAKVLGRTTALPISYLPKVGALIEAPAFYPPLSGRRNLEILAALGGHDAKQIPKVLELVGLAARAGSPYRTYSLGMKQRLGIAAALLPDPELLVLDEPTNGLDPAGIREMRELLRKIGSLGKTVFVSSHLMTEVQKLCTYLIVIRKGQLAFQGTVDQLLALQKGLLVRAENIADHPRLVALCAAAGQKAEAQGEFVLVHAPKEWAAELNKRAMNAKIVLVELRPQSGDLEETVLSITGKGGL
jgi:ABC-2 type transport system ATP-binding protein